MTDYVKNNFLINKEFNKEISYWESLLRNHPSLSYFNYDFIKSKKYEISSTKHNFSKTLFEKIKNISNNSEYSILIILLSAVHYILYRYTCCKDILSIIPIISKDSTKEFINSILPIKNEIEEKETFKNYVIKLKEIINEANTNQNVPFYKLIELLKLEPVNDKTYLFNNIVSFENIQNKNNIANLKFDTHFSFNINNNILELSLFYNSFLYCKKTIEQIIFHINTYLENCINNPDILIGNIEILSKREKDTILYDFNNTECFYPCKMTINELFENTVKLYPDKTAVITQDKNLTYKELNEKSNQLARLLRKKGVKPDDIIGISVNRSIEMIIGIMAIIKSGAAYLPIDITYPLERKLSMINISNAKIFLTTDYYISQFKKNKKDLEIINLNSNEINNEDVTNLQIINTSKNLVYIIYTSGSTGIPKGVMIEHHSLINRLHWMNKKYTLNDNDVILQKTTYTFDVSVWELFWWILAGASVCLLNPGGEKDPENIINYIEKYKISVLHFVPSMLSVFQDYIKNKNYNNKLSSLRYVFSSGEALTSNQVIKFHKYFNNSKLVNLYGPTEASIDVTYYDCSLKDENSIIPIGKPIDNISIYILFNNKIQPINTPGELYIGGVGLARGYINNKEMTLDKFIPNIFHKGSFLYKTGDIARWNFDGNIEFLGRKDHQVKIRGQRIELGEIEYHLLKYKDISNGIVISELINNTSIIIFFYISKKNISENDLKQYLIEILPEYMIPSLFIQINEIPLLSNGKIDRNKLIEIKNNILKNKNYDKPENKTEEILIIIWEKILNSKNININESFFNHGGDSIKAIVLINEINNKFETIIGLKEIYTYQTIKQLSGFINENKDHEIVNDLTSGYSIIDDFKKNILKNINPKKINEEYEDFYPLSLIQHSMVFYSQLRPDVPLYHDQFVYYVSIDDFNIDIFNKTLNVLIEKHDILRTVFIVNKFDQPVQLIIKKYNFFINYEDISGLEKELEINRYLKEDIQNKFKFDNDILWRIKLYKIDNNEYCFILSFHHAILDGWSVAVLNKEIIETYSNLINNNEYKSTKLETKYKDYIAINLIKEKSDNSINYWKNILENYNRTRLPFNINAKKINNTNRSKKVIKKIDIKLLNDLENQALNYNTSMKNLLISAYVYLMSILTNEDDIVIGIVTHNRPIIKDSEKILGCFLNTIPLRIKIEKNIRNLINNINNYLNNSIINELFLVDISNAIGESGEQKNPIFDCLFNFMDFHILEEIEKSGYIKKSNFVFDIDANEMTNTLFDLEVSRTLNEFVIWIKYSQDYFFDVDINTALNLYIRILEIFSKESNEFFNNEILLKNDEYEQTIYSYNNTQKEYPKSKTIHQLFEEQVEKTPNNTALVFKDKFLSYKELNKKANKLAAYLIANGVKTNDFVGIIADRNFDMLIIIFAILKSGAIYVPIDPDYPKNRKQYIIENSNISLIVTDSKVDIDFMNIININSINIDSYNDNNPDIYKKATDLAYVIYTSGSTGNPKGVMIEHHSVINLLEWVNNTFNVNENDNLLFITSICFDLSVYDIFGILSRGGKLVIVQKDQIQNIIELKSILQKYQITFWDSVPSTMNYLINTLDEEHSDFIQNNLRLVFLSGDWISVNLPDRIKKYFPKTKIISLGGATEGTVWSIYYPVEKVEKHQISIPYGKPIDNNYFYILDNNLNTVPKGVAGELYIGGVGVARGYINDFEKTSKSFIKNKFINSEKEMLYKTGDIGRFLPDGNIEFLGRMDSQLKIRGYRVEIGEIESHLLKYKDIKETVVIGKTDKSGNKYLCAYFTSNIEIDINDLKNYLSKFLPNYMIPSFFINLEKIPLTTNGKIDKKSLPDPNINLQKEFVVASNDIESELINIWKEVLVLDKISTDDNFFELGGHSLLASSLIAKINKAFDISMPLVEVFSNITLSDLSKKIINYKGKNSYKFEKAAKKEFYKLSSAQRRLFLLNRISDVGIAYNIPILLQIEGKFDKDKLYSIIKKIINRHESLRTSFIMINDEPFQKINEEIDFKIDLLQNYTGDTQKIIDSYIQPFNIENSRLYRIGLLSLNENKSIIIFDIHHIISDGISLQILINDFIKLYSGQVLPSLEFQYKDYSEWQIDQYESSKIKVHENYWLDMYSDEIPVLNLNTDYPRPLIQDFTGESIEIDFEIQIIEKINTFCKENNVTLFMFIMSVFYILLNKYTNQEDIIIGVPTEGRPLDELKNIFGMFVNILPIRNFIKDDFIYIDFLEIIKKSVINSFEHQNYQYEELLDNLKIQRNLSRNPLFDVVLVQMQSANDNYDLDGFKISPYKYKNNISKYDLTIAVIEKTNSFNLNIEYSTKLFKKESIERLIVHIKNIINECLTEKERKISEINLMDKNEIDYLLNINNNKNVNFPKDKTIIQLFEEQVKKYPNNLALSFKDQEMTYEILNNKSNCLAEKLISQGVKPEDIVAIVLNKSFEMLISIMAILKAGAAYLPIDPKYPKSRIKFMLENSHIKLILTTNELYDNFYKDYDKIFVEKNDIYNKITDNPKLIAIPDNTAYIIYTSGSTGTPKGVMINNKNVIRLLFNDKCLFNFKSSDIWALFHSYCFDFSVWEIFGALLHGGKLVIVPEQSSRDPNEFLVLLRNKKITILNQTPTAFYNLSNEEMKFTNNELFIKYIIFGGEKLFPKVLNDWKIKYPDTKFINMYGITETTVHVTYKEITENEIKENISNIGKPIPTLATYILNKYLKLCPIGVFGELCVGGEGVSQGYLNDPELTNKKFIINPYIKNEKIYKSGDYVRLLENGEMEYLGRIDTQVKIRGFRIELEEIERRLLEYNKIKQVKIIVKENNDNSKYLLAYYVSDNNLDNLEIRKFLLSCLPDYMVPSYFIKIDKMPLTSNGKIDYKLLPMPDKNNNSISEFEDSDNLELKVLSICKEVLILKNISLENNYFELGGDSIIAIRLINKVNKIFNTDLRIIDLYQNSNIKDFSNVIKDKMNLIDHKKTKITGSKKDQKLEAIKNKLLPNSSIEDIYPVSDIEFGMLFYYDRLKNQSVYHDQMVFFINENEFEDKTFCNAVNVLIKKHPILRTTYNITDYDIYIHLVNKTIKPVINIFLENFKNKVDEEYFIQNILKKDRDEPFNINNNLWRLYVIKINNEKVCLILTCHHAILDGWSVASFITELSNVYFDLKSNNFNITYLKNDYKQFIIEQDLIANDENIKKFWQNELKNYNRFVFDIAYNKNNNENIIHTITKDIDNTLFKKIKKNANEYNTNIKNILFCAYILTLYMISYESNFVVGIVENNRPECEDGDKILGCFLNTIPINVFIDTGKSYKDFIENISYKLINIKHYGKMSLKKIAEITEDKSNTNPFFDTLFNYIDFHIYNDAKFYNNEYDSDFIGFEKTNTLLDFNIINKFNEKIELRIDYSHHIFDENKIEKLILYYTNILKNIIERPNILINKADIIPEDEKYKLYNSFNNTYKEYNLNTTINKLFNEQAKKNPDKTAVVYENEKLTYKELEIKVNCIAKILRDNGVIPDKIVGILFDKSIEMIIAIMGVIKSGGAYLPLSPEDPDDRLKYYIDDSNTSIILTQKKHINRINFIKYKIVLDDENIYEKNNNELNDVNKYNDLAYIIYTSGSTGKPKGVMVEHRNVLNFSYWFNEMYNLEKNKNLILMTNYTFDVSVEEIIIPLLFGSTIYSAPKEIIYDKEYFYSYMIENKINLIQFVPTTLRELLIPNNKIESLNVVISGGERLDKNLINNTLEKGYELFNHYGPTETTMDCLSVKCRKNVEELGKPIANTKVFIFDKNNNIQPIGIIGEINISGYGVTRGYLNKKDITKKSYINDPYNPETRMYKTGDFGRFKEDGSIEFLGRIDNQIKINGLRIELGEIESLLIEYNEIESSIVIVKKDKNNIDYICAYYISNKNIILEDLKNYLKKSLPYYMIPKYIIKIDSYPINQNGKIDYKLLPEPEINKKTNLEINNSIYNNLVNIWKETLKINYIDINDNFFDLGGNSLSAISIISKIKKVFNIEIKLNDFFQNLSIKNLYKIIISSSKTDYYYVEKSDKKEFYDLSLPQKTIYFSNQFHNKLNLNYNMPNAILIEGKLEIKKINEIFNIIIQRHESFRTAFEEINGNIFQKVYENIKIKIDYIENISEEKINDYINQLVIPFDLTKAPLLKIYLIMLNPNRHILFIDIHHIISDEISMKIIIKEFINLYNGDNIENINLQYRDYIKWHYDIRKKGLIKQQEKYWQSVFKDNNKILNLPYDFKRHKSHEKYGNKIKITLDDKIFKKLKSLEKENNSTLYMIILSIYNILLFCFTEQNDITIGTPVSGRTHNDFFNTTGLFINILPMRNYLQENLTFIDFLNEVKINTLNAFENQDYHLSELINFFISKNNYQQIFNTFYVYNTIEEKEILINNLKISNYDFNFSSPKYDLILMVEDYINYIDLIFEYDTSLFKKDTIENLFKRFLNILDEIVINKDIKLKEIKNNDEYRDSNIKKSDIKKLNEININLNF